MDKKDKGFFDCWNCCNKIAILCTFAQFQDIKMLAENRHGSDSCFTNIQALRALAALLVVAYHIYFCETKFLPGHVLPNVISQFGAGGVDLFFVISGFIMVSISRDQFGAVSSALTFLKHRALRVYPIYWLYSLIILPLIVFKVEGTSGRPVDILASFALLPSHTMPLLVQGWTLVYEMFFYLVFAAAIAFSSRRFLWATLAAWAIITAALALWVKSASINNAALNVISNPLVFEFIAGCFIALIWRAIPRWALVPILVISLLIGVGVWIAAGQIAFETLVQWRAAYFGTISFFVVLSAVLAEKRFGMAAPRLLRSIGDASYSIYLSHLLVISAIMRVWILLAPPSIWLWGTGIAFVAAIVLGIASFKWLETPINLAAKKLLFSHSRSKLSHLCT